MHAADSAPTMTQVECCTPQELTPRVGGRMARPAVLTDTWKLSFRLAAHQTCPYSKAIRGNVDVVINVI